MRKICLVLITVLLLTQAGLAQYSQVLPFLGKRTVEPSTCQASQIYFNTTSQVYRFCANGEWADMNAPATQSVSRANSPAISFLGTGAVESPLTAILNISPNAGNALSLAEGGLYVNQEQGNYALRFDPTKAHHVDHGYYWVANTSYQNFYYEAWTKPLTGAEYIISAGYGGWHDLLWGFNGCPGGICTITGNIAGNAGSGGADPARSYNCTIEPTRAGDWHHHAVAYDGNNIWTFLDGVPCSRTSKTTARRSNSDFEGSMLVGGSDHSNYAGLIAKVRGWENYTPVTGDAFGTIVPVYYPERHFRVAYIGTPAPNFLADYTIKQTTISDLSKGLNGVLHPGVLGKSVYAEFGGEAGEVAADLPQWVIDPITKPTTTLSVPATPAGALVFDSFNRDDSSPAWGAFSLGTTPAGSLGARAWTYTDGVGAVAANVYGVQNGRVFSRGSGVTGTPRAAVDVGTANIKTCVDVTGGEPYNALSLHVAYTNATNQVLLSIAGNSLTLVNAATSATLGTSTIPGFPAASTICLEYTSAELQKVWVNGSVVINYNDAASAAKTGTQTGFSQGNRLGRLDNFTVYTAVP